MARGCRSQNVSSRAYFFELESTSQVRDGLQQERVIGSSQDDLREESLESDSRLGLYLTHEFKVRSFLFLPGRDGQEYASRRLRGKPLLP